MFVSHKYEELSYPKKSENVQPHSSNSIENATSLYIVTPVMKMRPHQAAHPY